MNNKNKKAIISPIKAEDLADIGQFLNSNFNASWGVDEWQTLFTSGWDSSPIDMGRMAKVGDDIVGVIGALYSTRNIAGCNENFCNIHSWVTLESHRTSSLPLLMSLIQDNTRHYTNVTANQKAYQSSRFVKFKVLETAFSAFPNIPSITGFLKFGCKVLNNPQTVKPALDLILPGVYDDFKHTANLTQLLFQKDGKSLHIVYRKSTWKSWSCAQIIRAHPIELFQSWLPLIKTNLFLNKIAYITVDRRFLGEVKPWFMESQDYPVPLIYLSNKLDAKQIDNGYTDRVILDSMLASKNSS
ncbi:MAG: hypothetical protein HQL71_04685 [Magnetococcales bacterium]|nr:hypothetical protein [Magnetococcales bacterium]